MRTVPIYLKMYTIKKEDKELLKKVYNFAKNRKVQLYIVGGYLRDLILKREKDYPDIDFCLKSGAIKFGRELATELKAGFVILDSEHGCCRIVKRMDNVFYTLDFTDFRGPSLKDDLLHRDFTINALAINLKEALSQAKIRKDLFLDLFNGQEDIELKTIRIIKKENFDEDPLRILRAFSLSSIFDFKIEDKTFKLAQSKKRKLLEVSPERIRDELFKILDSEYTYRCLKGLDKTGILELIMPEIKPMRGLNQGPYHHLDVLEHSFETVKQVEHILSKEYIRNEEFQDYMNEVISSMRKRKSLLKLGAFLHDIGKPKTMRHEKERTIFHGHECVGAGISKSIARRLKFSNDELDALKKMVFWHLRPGYMADATVLTKRAKFRFFRDCAKEAVSVLVVSLADQRSTRGPLTLEDARLDHERVVSALIKEYFKKLKEKKVEHLIDGFDLMRKFKIDPGPLIGKVLSEIEELQATNTVKTKKDALLKAGKIIAKIKKNVKSR